MDSRNEIREFLVTRRARITPQQAGLPSYGRNRRVPGLRREEVALLAGVSVDYYTRLERGNASGVSESVLEALARALQLNEVESAHLFDLARAASPRARTRRRTARRREEVRPGVLRVLEAMTGAPAVVQNRRLDVLATNRLGRALYSDMDIALPRPANYARFIFLDQRATRFYRDWDKAAHDTVALLRSEAGRDPYDRELSDLVGELSTRSEAFRGLWAAHNVHAHTTGVKRLRHPVVGDLDLAFEAMELAADTGLSLFVYTAEQGSASQDGLKLLASWSATLDEAENARAAGEA
ncbi:helix-turn-helix domain-containing protein [Marinitenerispora sediminis]|uniref:Transcriptional regulator n=1 Tax=Marinitenerispora sediminis TaxID=1931232 RepID=A0A368TEV1_9ACTN|nr:helix-turn-helix transcriptional regulator [Marinitenerispora sediminis]RCV57956.1 transcriptional regulator [Marinitenerispora sediminis]RCV62311.1 transcriptional regulator [Marinitenerispora sediminis]RCV62557.1 transcriptional regulator [Marinitenerispora sediminis]